VAELLPVTLLRPLVRRLVTSVWAALHTRTEVVWSFDPATLKPPVIIAGGPHLHWHDLLAVSHVLPPQLRRRILVVTDPFLHSYKSFFYYHVVAPSLFAIAFLRPFGRSREGLLEAGRLLDLRHTMLTFPAGPRPSEDPRDFNPGGSRFALEAGVPIVPVRLSGNQGIGWKPRRPRRLFRLHFGEPIVPSPAMDTAQVLAELQRAFERLQQAAAPPGANAPE
jgi:1-acyl-sn-glycerol-3-phosphate acyltransferase